MDFELVFENLLEKFAEKEVSFALIGGFALQAFGYSRATQDVDLLISAEDIQKVKEILSNMSYRIIHESENAINFWSDTAPLGNIDILIACRKYSRAMLNRAVIKDILGKYSIQVIIPEDIIGLKIQSSSNDPSRWSQDMADIRQMIQLHKQTLNVELLREYFALFDREHELKELLGDQDVE